MPLSISRVIGVLARGIALSALVIAAPRAEARPQDVSAPVQDIDGLLDRAKALAAQGRSDEAIRALMQAITALQRMQAVAGQPAPPVGAAVRVGGDVHAPTRLLNVPPVYPQDARDARVQGRVILEAVINESGDVTDVRVLRAVPMLEQAAIDAVSQWKYAPTTINGSPVSVIMTVTVDFSLQ